MKRFIAILLSAVCLCSVLAGCADKPINSDKPDSGKQDSAPQLEVNLAPEQTPANEITVAASSKSGEKYGDRELFAIEELTTASPDGEIKAYFWLDEAGALYYSVKADKEQVIEPSRLGMVVDMWNMGGIDTVKTYDAPKLVNTAFETCETISLDKYCVDRCNEQTATFFTGENSFTLKIRVYDDGFAYRFTDVNLAGAKTVTVTDEYSEVILPEGTNTFAGGYSMTYEMYYDKRDYNGLKNHNGVFNAPVTAETKNHWLLIAEADVYAGDITYGKSVIETKSGEPNLVWSIGFMRDPTFIPENELSASKNIRQNEVRTTNGFETPWRVAIIADSLSEMVATTTIDALGAPFDAELFKSTDWIQPGKVSWSWWSGDSQYDPEIVKQYVDFASQNGWEYYCLDAGWPSFEDKIPELVEYAEERNVKLILWVNYMNIDTPEKVEASFKQWHEWGVAGVKTDYFESDEIKVLESMRDCAAIGAKYELLMYYHGCICPNGETRTYPNIMTTEAVMGEEFRKWGESPANYVCLMYPFTRNVVGSMDYTPSTVRIAKTGETGGFALAKSIVYESSLQHFAANAKIFPSFIGLPMLNRIPTVWEYSELLEGYPGELATYLRSDGEDFYVGTMSLKARKQDIKLDFLDEGEYFAYLYHDDEKGDLMLTESKVTSADTVTVDIPDNGGFALYITKNEMDTTVEEAFDAKLEGYTYYECEEGETKGNANVQDSMMCSGGKKVGYIGQGNFNRLTVNVTAPEDGEYELLVYYCSGETRYMTVTVGEKEYELKELNSGGFDTYAIEKLTVTLKKGDNEIVFSQDIGYAPDLDRIAVSDKAK